MKPFNPTTQAEIDFSEGSNENPFDVDTPEYQDYEQHFDTLCREAEKLEAGEMQCQM